VVHLGTVVEEQDNADKKPSCNAKMQLLNPPSELTGRKKSVQLGKELFCKPQGSDDPRPSLVGRPSIADLGKRRNSKWTSMRRMSIMSGGSTGSSASKEKKGDATPEPQKTIPPTYRLKPKEDEEFHSWSAKTQLQDLLAVYSSDLTYDAKACARQSLILADMIKNKMKNIGCNRHKIVVLVDIGENKNQDLQSASRCVWDTNTDDSLHLTHVTNDVYVVVNVFAIYKD